MYAQLCKRLSEETPNFNPEGPCTFNILLLSKCQDEFERRWRANEAWDGSENEILTPEEEEQKMSTRRKMVGNLRFIGELGKLEIINESILHRCIQQCFTCSQLLEERLRSMADMAEDLECLCQIMKTCGKVLDKPKAKNLMDQYFERMSKLRYNLELPSRIRFMLQDVIELRAAKWVPRKAAQIEGPRTIQQVRDEAARDLGVYIPPPSSQGQQRNSGPISPLAGLPSFFPQAGNGRTGMEDVFGNPPMGAVTLGTGPGVISSQPDKFSYDTNGYNTNSNGRDQGFRQRQQQGGYTQNSFYQNKHFNNQSYNRQQQNNQFNQQQNYNNAGNKDLPPRFKKLFPGNAGDDISLRPTTMSLKPKTPGLLPQSALDCSNHNDGHNSGLPITPQPQPPNQRQTPPLMHKEPPILIKQMSLEKPRASRKEKGSSREAHLKTTFTVLQDYLSDPSTTDDAVVHCYRNCRVPERLSGDVFHQYVVAMLRMDDVQRTQCVDFLVLLNKDINNNRMLEGIKKVFNQLEELSSEIVNCKTRLAAIIGGLVTRECLTLIEVTEPLEGGEYFPLMFAILQHLNQDWGKVKLTENFNNCKINLLNLIPECDRTKEKLAEILEERELSFLSPLLRIQADLWSCLKIDATPHSFFKNIKDTVDGDHHTSPGFINALVTVLVKYITEETTLSIEVDQTAAPEKSVTELEKELLSKFKKVLQAFLHDHLSLQVIAVYALQVFTYTNNFPKGMLLRWFINLYDLEIIEEEAFLAWKEDLSEAYPGKGKALFQVNQWLTWLQETEEDEEEEEGDA